jgi:hypothetical protein
VKFHHILLLIVVLGPLVVDAIERARMRAGLTHQDLAYYQGISEGQWSQQRAGRGHIALDRLIEAPGHFWSYLSDELRAVKCGGQHTLEDVYQLLSDLRPQMARASLAVAQKAERIA